MFSHFLTPSLSLSPLSLPPSLPPSLPLSPCSGAEALPDIDVVKKKFVINLVLPSGDQTGELRLIFETVSLIICTHRGRRVTSGPIT